MVCRQLTETARVTQASADTIKEALGDGVVATQGSAASIRESVGDLTKALQQSSTDLEAASKQSVKLGRRLNLLTGVLVIPALISAAATAFYAWETQRLVDLTERQLQRTQPALQEPRNSPLTPSPKH